jgi:hypothetical protein
MGMETERNDLEKVLNALGRAEAPEGLEARVVAGVERRMLAGRGSEVRWLEMFAGPVVGVWWRGAVSGAAVALLVVGIAAMVEGHFGRASRGGDARTAQVVTPSGTPTDVAVLGVARREDSRVPCASSGVMRALGAVPAASRPEQVQSGVEVADQPQTITERTLTAEERNLVRVARSADLQELAMLNPEMRERQAAEEAAQFKSFFAEQVKPAATPPTATPEAATGAIAEPVTAEPVATQTPAEPAAGDNQ